jgi:autotransporter-associated beta strand protein
VVLSGGFACAGGDANAGVFYFKGGGSDTLLSTGDNWVGGTAPNFTLSSGSLSAATIVVPAVPATTLLPGGTPVDVSTAGDANAPVPALISAGALRVTSVLPRGEVTLGTSDPNGGSLSFLKVDVQTGAKLTIDGSNSLKVQGDANVGIDFNSGGGAGEVVVDAVLEGGPVSVTGGTVTLNQQNAYAGATTVDGGKLVVGSNGTFGLTNGAPSGKLILKSGIVELNPFSAAVKEVEINEGVIGGVSGAGLTVESKVAADVAAGKTAAISAAIADGTSGPVALLKTGAGRLSLSGANTYSGTSTISGGVVEVASSTAFGDSSALVELSGGTLTADSAPRTVANPVVLSGAAQLGETASGKLTLDGGVKVEGKPLTVVGEVEVSGVGLDGDGVGASGALVFNGPGNLVLSAGNTHTGTTVNGGTLEVRTNLGNSSGGLNVNGGAVKLAAGAQVEVGGVSITGGRIDGTNPVDELGVNGDLIAAVAAGNTATISASIADGTTSQAALSKTGAGRLVLSGTNTYTGASTIREGVLEVASNKPFGESSAVVNLAGGTLTVDAAARVIPNTVEVQAGRSTVGGEGTDITLNALTFQPAAAVNINGAVKILQGTDLNLNGGTVAFGTGKTNGSTLLRLSKGITATTASTISFTKDARILADGGAGQKIDFRKVQLAVSPEALADAAQSLRVGSPAQYQVVSLQGGAVDDIDLGSNPALGATAAVNVSFALVDPATAGALVSPGVSLQFTRNTYQSIARTPNAKAFAAALDQRLSQLESTSPLGQLTKKLDAIVDASGVESELRGVNSAPMYASMYTVATRRLLAVTSALDSHLDSLAETASSDAVYSFGVSRVRSNLEAPVAPPVGVPAVVEEDRQWTAWVSGYSTESNLREDAAAGFGKIRSTDTGGSLGVERKFGDLRLGLLAATGQGDTSFDGGGNVDTDHWHAGGYASVALGSATVDASALWGSADNTTRRPFGGAQVRSDFGSSDTQLGVGLALNLAEPSSLWQLTPVARLKYLGYTQDGFVEKGAGFLQADKMSDSTWISKLGMRFSRRGEAGKKVAIGLDGGAYWVHDYSPEGKAMNVRFSGTNTSFSAIGRNADSDFIQVNLGLNATFSNAVTVRMGWQQDFGGNRNQGIGIISCAINF